MILSPFQSTDLFFKKLYSLMAVMKLSHSLYLSFLHCQVGTALFFFSIIIIIVFFFTSIRTPLIKALLQFNTKKKKNTIAVI